MKEWLVILGQKLVNLTNKKGNVTTKMGRREYILTNTLPYNGNVIVLFCNRIWTQWRREVGAWGCTCPPPHLKKEKISCRAHIFYYIKIKIILLCPQNYIFDMCSSIEFWEFKCIGDLTRTMVKVGRDKVYPLIYRLKIFVLLC